MEVMLAGELRRSGDLDAPAAEPAEVVAPPPVAVVCEDAERERYLEAIVDAPAEVINRTIRRLVRARVFHIEFDQVVRNPRWFSLMDLRRIALDVAAAHRPRTRRRTRSLKSTRTASDTNCKSKHRSQRRTKCQSQPPQTPTIKSSRRQSPQLPQLPSPPQPQQPLLPLEFSQT